MDFPHTHCRFCGEDRKPQDLINFSDKNILQDCEKILKFLKIDFIDFESLILPKTTCKSCYKYLQDIHEFFKKMRDAQIVLNNFYSNLNQNFETAVKEENLDEFGPSNIEMDIREETVLRNPENIIKLDFENQKSNLDLDIEIESDFENTSFIEDNDFDKISTKDLKKSEKWNQHSWSDYEWICQHCGAKFDTMSSLRDHSKVVHAICFGFKCVDCTEMFNYYNPFIEHVRQHRNSLRLFCHYCNLKCSTPKLALEHSITHWDSASICDRCGELLTSAGALQRHKKVYKKVVLPQKCSKNKKKLKKIVCCISWKEYDWTCQDCNLRLADVESLRTHTRNAHGKCFSMKCGDCLAVMANYKQFVEHVSSHRTCLENYCQYCNAFNSDQTELNEHRSTHFEGTKPCEGCGEIFPDSTTLAHHMTLYDTPRVRGSNNSEGLTCGVCNKHFANSFQLKNHKVIHSDKRDRDQVCHSCGKAFFDVKTLTNHIRTHFNKTELCEICHKTFLTKQRLKVHISTHFEAKQFVCNECEKKFRRKSQLRLHLASHSDELPFQCGSCSKSFRLRSYLKIHERQHTGIRPYTCEICSESFNHWGNCNRHMIRKHGITFAKTKITEHGKVDINRQTGEPKAIELGSHAKDWCDEMLRPKKRGRRKKVVS